MVKVITVEDSPVVVERMRVLLSDLPAIQFSGNAVSITEAEKLMAEQQADLAILDIHLKANAPHRSGIDLLSSLKRNYPDMVIIMLTNLSSAQYREKCLSLGASYFFDKSSDFDKMTDTIEAICKHKMGLIPETK